jgi:hypothetical protein
MLRFRREREVALNDEVPVHLTGADRDYFLTYGTYPPYVDPSTSTEALQNRIDSMSSLANESRDPKASELLVREIGYLADKLIELRQV